jgi:two-component system, LytTR family, sensor kinase
MKNSIQIFCVHFFLWLAFFVLPFVFFPKPQELVFNQNNHHFFLHLLLTNGFLVLVFYFNSKFAIPRYYFAKNYVILFTCLLGYLFIGLLLLNLFEPPPPPRSFLLPPKGNQMFGSFLIRFVFIILTSFGIEIYKRWQQSERERSQAELAFLRAQINPHFLFNTLNGIYMLAVKQSAETAGSVHKLSSIMRHSLLEAVHEKVELEKEVQYIKDYIELQKLRLSDKVKLNLEFNGDFKDKSIVPMLFISFLENAFKYGTSTEESCTIDFNLTVFRNELSLQIKNRVLGKDARVEKVSGIGILNTKQRLNHFYPKQHVLQIIEEEGTFEVLLKLQLI